MNRDLRKANTRGTVYLSHAKETAKLIEEAATSAPTNQ